MFAGGKNTLTLSGYQVSAQITQAGGAAQAQAEIVIYGLSQENMNTPASVGNPTYFFNSNTVTVMAGDAENGMSQAFTGTIGDAYADYMRAPEVVFVLEAMDTSSLATTPATPVSFDGATSVATLMAVFASKAGLILDNSGVTATLSNPYFPGGALDQIRACARHANINFQISNRVLAIWPKDGARQSSFVPLISPETGLVGYPTYSQQGVRFQCLYNPTLVFGTKAQVQSSLPQATGVWAINSLQHSLESMIPDGDWFTYVEAWGLELYKAATAAG